MIYTFLIFILGLCNYIPIHFVGIIRVGELLFLTFNIIFLLTQFKRIRKIKVFKYFYFLMVVGILVSTISTFKYNNGLIEYFKGLANYLFTLSSVVAIFTIVNYKIWRAAFFFLGLTCSAILFNPYKVINEKYSVTNYDTAYFDVVITPVLLPFLLFLFCLSVDSKYQKYMKAVGVLVGAIALMNDSKSTGLILVLAVIFSSINLAFFVSNYKRRILTFLIGPVFILFGLYKLAQNGLAGKTSSEYTLENFEKTKRINPFLLVSRPDPIIGLIAFSNRPMIGHGYNHYDKSYRKLAVILGFLPKDLELEEKGVIPTHSILVNSLVEGGIFGALVWTFILYLAVTFMFKLFRNKEKNVIFYIVFLSIVWNILFSPIGYIRLSFPIEFAILLTYLLYHKYNFRNYLNNHNSES